MYIIVGLGNPTDKYKGTRHNIGFDVIDKLAEMYNIKMNGCKHKALCGKGTIGQNAVLLAKPLTYMNLSGESVKALVDYYKVNFENEVIIVYDDIDLDVGQIRVRAKGSAGGHNGIKSIISYLGTQNFRRVRLGVGNKPEKIDLADYVLGHFDAIDKVKANEGINVAVHAIDSIMKNGIEAAMNTFNVSKK